MSKKVFVALPEITTPDIIEAMRNSLTAAGFDAVFAIDVAPKDKDDMSATEVTKAKFTAICHAMKESDLLIANITPYLGVEPDPDVTFQLGYMAAQQKPVFSFTNVSKPFYDRVLAWNGEAFITEEQKGESGHVALLKRDRDLMRIENMGIKDYSYETDAPGADNYNNLMLEGPSIMTDSRVLTPKIIGSEISEENLYTDLSVFQQTVEEAKQHVLIEGKTKAAPPRRYDENQQAAYLAGPGVFLPNLFEYFSQIKAITEQQGIKGIAPIDAQIDFGEMQTWALPNGNNPEMRKAIYIGDTSVMQSVRMGFFNLTPHHGVAGDSGTIFEMGYMVGKDDVLKRLPMVFGFSTAEKHLLARINDWNDKPQGPIYGGKQAQDHHSRSKTTGIYSDMIDGAILTSRGSLDHRPNSEMFAQRQLQQDAQYSHVEEFEQCVRSTAKLLTDTKNLKQAARSLNTSGDAMWPKTSKTPEASQTPANSPNREQGMSLPCS